MDDSYETFQLTGRFRSLDGLRCLAILGVLWHHSDVPGEILSPPLNRGYLGVNLFFVLSGFLITTILLRERARTGRVSIKNFYVRRLLRIFPLYYAYLLFLCATIYLLHADSPAGQKFFQAVPYYATYTSNWLPVESHEPIFARSWSLAVEEQFYLVWPALFVLVGSRRVIPILLGFIALVVAGEIGVFGERWQLFARYLGPFTAITIGVLLAIALSRPAPFRVIWSVLGRWGSSLVVAVLLGALLCVPGNVTGFFSLAVHLMMAALVGAVVLRPNHALSRLLDARVVAHVGIVSYGIYVLHGQLGGATWRVANAIASILHTPDLSARRDIRFVILVVLSTIVATLSYYFFESYFLRLKEKWSSTDRPTKSAETTAIDAAAPMPKLSSDH